jgi:hypothetical protein
LPVTFAKERRAAGRNTAAGARREALKQGGHTTRDWPDRSDFVDKAGRLYVASPAATLNTSPAHTSTLWLDFILPMGGKRLEEEVPKGGSLLLTMSADQIQSTVEVTVTEHSIPTPKQRYGQVQVSGLSRPLRLFLIDRANGGGKQGSGGKKTKLPIKPGHNTTRTVRGGRVDK